MARTKASVGAKVSAGKSSKVRCSAAAPPSSNLNTSGGEKSHRSHSGGNPVCPRETPKWQKPITNFFITNQSKQSDDNEAAGSSKSKPKRNVIYSDDESDSEEQTSKIQDERKQSESSLNKGTENEEKSNESLGKESILNKSTPNETTEDKSTEEEKEENAESQVYECSQDYDSPPKNRELDESIILETLTGEKSHKLEEYYPKNTKKGKKESNNNKVSFKRHSEDIESPRAKKIKIN